MPWFDLVCTGAAGGVLILVLLLRLNPEVVLDLQSLVLVSVLWTSWGILFVGGIVALTVLLVRRLRRRPNAPRRWNGPEIVAVVFVLAAVLNRVNADLHHRFLSPIAHRTIGQDAVAWLIASLLILAAGSWLRKRGPGWRPRAAFAAFVLFLPLVRLVGQPTPVGRPVRVPVAPIGAPERQLVVIGIEGLDAGVLLTRAAGGRYPTLSRLTSDGAWGTVDAYRPYLRRSLWTTLAVGAYPRRHGVKFRWAWRMPWVFEEPIRLLPSTPLGSGWVLAWGVARKGPPPPPIVPALWERLRASGVAGRVDGWPGVWAPGVVDEPVPLGVGSRALEPIDRADLEAVLEPFPEFRDRIRRAVLYDLGGLTALRSGLEKGHGNLWIRLRSLDSVRRVLEPLYAQDTRQRQVYELVLELIDEQLESVLRAAGPEPLVAVVSPYGLDPPDSWERLRRLLGFGAGWTTTARSCPDGVLVLLGQGVREGHRLSRAQLTDVVPTLCYLTGLPIARYMEGRVVLDAVDPAFVAGHPLRVLDR